MPVRIMPRPESGDRKASETRHPSLSSAWVTRVASAPDALASLRWAKKAGKPFPPVIERCSHARNGIFAEQPKIKHDPALAESATMMLTLGGQRGDGARCREIGVEALAVGSSREVLASLEGGAFDLVLMDVQMPEMDGFEATAAICQGERATGAHLPIIAMTHAMQGDRERCLAAGMDGCVTKPVGVKELFAPIEGVLQPRNQVETPT